MPEIKKYLNNNKHWLVVVLAATLVVPAVWALFVPGFYGASDDLHVAWFYEMNRLFQIGQFPPRFVPDLSFGFGYPLFNFVFPLPFYLGQIIHLLGFSFVDSVKGVFFLSLVLSGVAMYFLLKEFCDKVLALAGALVYIYTPYRSTDTYVRGDIGEALAFVFLPIISLSLFKLSVSQTQTKNRLNLFWIGVGGLALALLILCHNITAYMFFPAALILSLLAILFLSKNKIFSLIQVSVTILVGLLISLYFWLPAILDSNLVKYDTVFNFVDHFPTLHQLFVPYWGYGASVPGPGDGLSFFIGSVNLVLMALSLMLSLLFWRKYPLKSRVLITWTYLIFVIALVMMNFRSIFIWKSIPLLPYFQFPWRFLILTTFITSVLVVNLNIFKRRLIFASLVIGLTLLLNASFFRPHDFLGRQDDYYLNRYIPVPQASSEYLKTGEEYLRLPVKTEMRPTRNYSLVFDAAGNFPVSGVVQAQAINPLSAQITTASDQPFVLNYSKYFFPGWVATIDQSPVQPFAGRPFGQVSLNIPAGRHQVEINFKETPLKIILDLISLAILLIGFFVIIKGYNRRSNHEI